MRRQLRCFHQAGELAEEQGYAQVLWLDGVEKKYVEEVGSMNIMFKIDGKVYTAATVGTVLPGVTRRSCIELLKDWGYDVIEGKLAIADIMQAAREGKLEEVFGTWYRRSRLPCQGAGLEGRARYIGDGKIGPVTQKLYDTMTGMQWGKIPTPRAGSFLWNKRQKSPLFRSENSIFLAPGGFERSGRYLYELSVNSCANYTKQCVVNVACCTSAHLANSTKIVYYKYIESESFRATAKEEEYQSALPNP